MTIQRFIHAGIMAAVVCFMLAATASASTIEYNTLTSVFFGDGLTLDSSSGQTATLTFTPASDTTVGTPTNISFGSFQLACATCTPTAGATFSSFTFDLIVTDVTAGATGEYVGTGTGGTVFSNVSPISITWSPLQLGPGLSGAISGDFGAAVFDISSPTLIVAPNSNGGNTTVQGVVSVVVPEPATLAMVGGAFIGLAALARRRRR